ncbi:MAG: hypothetical protein Q8M83_00530 [bacterium]|nr:hypothetical protein [bacterium]
MSNQVEEKRVYVIDCDVPPVPPDGMRVFSHKTDGKMEWNPERIKLCVSKRQEERSFPHGPFVSIHGRELLVDFKGERVLNANVIDFLLTHPELTPKDWRGEIFFWGTTFVSYESGDGYKFVRYLRKEKDDRWYAASRWLGDLNDYSRAFAACLT